ncbi:hypothetical protein GH714_000596 [Hevea brasiliensis]|uniref:Histone H2A n=1 Tax=Hevea brasiliensis TaxID=3981 RepID=A0A6A6LY30_HEVBR|nr:hypothetical protein GH714_000596 [Hevea brasiliensis]
MTRFPLSRFSPASYTSLPVVSAQIAAVSLSTVFFLFYPTFLLAALDLSVIYMDSVRFAFGSFRDLHEFDDICVDEDYQLGEKRLAQKGGLHFPAVRIARFLKAGKYAKQLGARAPVCLSAVLEYLAAEKKFVQQFRKCRELVMNVAREFSRRVGASEFKCP